MNLESLESRVIVGDSTGPCDWCGHEPAREVVVTDPWGRAVRLVKCRACREAIRAIEAEE